MELNKIAIKLIGCDDVTRIDIDVTSEELNLLERVSELSKQISEYPCMPVMEIKRSNEVEK